MHKTTAYKIDISSRVERKLDQLERMISDIKQIVNTLEKRK